MAQSWLMGSQMADKENTPLPLGVYTSSASINDGLPTIQFQMPFLRFRIDNRYILFICSSGK